jgi:hypothetical protein
MEYVDLIKGFFLSPVATFRKVMDTGSRDTLVYFLVLVLISTVLSILVMLASPPPAWFTGVNTLLGIGSLSGLGIVIIAVMMIIAAVFLLFVGSAWLHLWVYVFGGRKGIRETFKALAFGGTPALLLGWIPVVGILAGIWALVLSVLGVRELHGISTARALGAVIIAVIIPLLILVLLAAFLFIAYTQTGPLPAAVY